MPKRRHVDVVDDNERVKKIKISPSGSQFIGGESSTEPIANTEQQKGQEKPMDDGNQTQPPNNKPKRKINKLVPPRPFPTVSASVSATGPRSAHKEGTNFICVTRKTPLGAYLRRCKDVVMKDGHKTLHLNAMGAAIPHLLQIAVSLPSILPFAQEEIHTEVLTGTIEVRDEVIPEDENEDLTYQTRSKSTLNVVIKIGDGKDEGNRAGEGKAKANTIKGENSNKQSSPMQETESI